MSSDTQLRFAAALAAHTCANPGPAVRYDEALSCGSAFSGFAVIRVASIGIAFKPTQQSFIDLVEDTSQKPLGEEGRYSDCVADFLDGCAAPLHDQDKCVEQAGCCLHIYDWQDRGQVTNDVVVVTPGLLQQGFSRCSVQYV